MYVFKTSAVAVVASDAAILNHSYGLCFMGRLNLNLLLPATFGILFVLFINSSQNVVVVSFTFMLWTAFVSTLTLHT